MEIQEVTKKKKERIRKTEKQTEFVRIFALLTLKLYLLIG